MHSMTYETKTKRWFGWRFHSFWCWTLLGHWQMIGKKPSVCVCVLCEGVYKFVLQMLYLKLNVMCARAWTVKRIVLFVVILTKKDTHRNAMGKMEYSHAFQSDVQCKFNHFFHVNILRSTHMHTKLATHQFASFQLSDGWLLLWLQTADTAISLYSGRKFVQIDLCDHCCGFLSIDFSSAWEGDSCVYLSVSSGRYARKHTQCQEWDLTTCATCVNWFVLHTTAIANDWICYYCCRRWLTIIIDTQIIYCMDFV